MIVKPALAGALVLASLPPLEWPVTIYTQHPFIERMECGTATGTGFKLSNGLWVTANHVTSGRGCFVDGKPVTVIYSNRETDLAVFVVDDDRAGGIEVNCEGFRDRAWYFGEGHGRGDPNPQIVAVRYSALFTAFNNGPWGILEVNRFVPGMSGGPVLSQDGRAVGVVNAYGTVQKISFSMPLKDTPLCR